MEEKTKQQIWEKLQKFAEKRVRQEKRGYLQLLKIQERSDEVISTKKWDDIDAAIHEEQEKGYSEEDLRFFWSNSASEWFVNILLYKENKVTGTAKKVKEIDCNCPVHLRLQGLDMDGRSKEEVLKAKELEKRFNEEEQIARQHLKHELEAKDKAIEEKDRDIERLRATIQELKMELEPESEEEVEA